MTATHTKRRGVNGNPLAYEHAQHLLNIARESGITATVFKRLVETGLLTELFRAPNPGDIDRQAFRRLIGSEDGLDGTFFDVLVNTGEPFLVKIERLRKLGIEFDRSHFRRPLKPPQGGSGLARRKVTLLQPSPRMQSTTKAVEFIRARGLEPGDPFQLADFLEQHARRLEPNIFAGLVIAAVGYVHQDEQSSCIFAFGSAGRQRIFDDLWRFEWDWDEGTRFLAVEPLSLAA